LGSQQLLDAVPVPLLLILVCVLAFAIHEGGYRLGSWKARTDPGEKNGPTGLLVGAILALMGFLLATSTAMAADRFDGRRALVVDEANAIRTVFLRAGYLDASPSTEIRNQLRQYAPLRINVLDPDVYEQNLAASKAMLKDLWAETEAVAREHGDEPVVALFVESLNDAEDLLATREAALTNGRVPETVVWLLFLGALLSAGTVGFHGGLTSRRGFVGAGALIVMLSAALVFVIGLDRPREDLLRVSQGPLDNVIELMGPRAP
jgi:hypothetical protein